jgi:hypothetical protein
VYLLLEFPVAKISGAADFFCKMQNCSRGLFRSNTRALISLGLRGVKMAGDLLHQNPPPKGLQGYLMKVQSAVSLLSLVVVSALAVPGAAPARQAAQTQAQVVPAKATTSTQTVTLFGRIRKSDGSYVLIESASKAHFVLDDQKAAKHYNGRVVVITGTMDGGSTVHVQRIEVAS